MLSDERQLAEEMLFELENSHFEVVLVPAPEPRHSMHQVRALQSANPAWYSRFTAQYVNCRGIGKKRMTRPRTYIVKRLTIAALKRMLDGDMNGIYAERLIGFIRRELWRRERAERATKPTEWLTAANGKAILF